MDDDSARARAALAAAPDAFPKLGVHRLTKTEKQKMLAGELYRPDAELGADEQAAAKAWLARYNAAAGIGRFPSGTRCSPNASAASARTP